MSPQTPQADPVWHETRVLPVDAKRIGRFVFNGDEQSFQNDWDIELDHNYPDAEHLQEAARLLQNSDTPVAFPTETVYGLGADATRNSAVSGIYTVKQRPSDNPLIVHVCSLSQLRKLLLPQGGQTDESSSSHASRDPIPAIYHPLISRFWPGPLTIILPLPQPSSLAPLVTGTLSTFGARMPSSTLALGLIRLADVPLAAPSANASTKPSPTTAAHVLHDLSGRIDLILDGGACDIGVESTVVDGLVDPPVILRPGQISIEMLRQCPGWDRAAVGYEQSPQTAAPRAPGMKYKHYSPRARLLLIDGQLSTNIILTFLGQNERAGILQTVSWTDEQLERLESLYDLNPELGHQSKIAAVNGNVVADSSIVAPQIKEYQIMDYRNPETAQVKLFTTSLGSDVASIAHGLFSAIRTLDQLGVNIIFVEGIDESHGDAAAAIMNRLRKAAEQHIKV